MSEFVCADCHKDLKRADFLCYLENYDKQVCLECLELDYNYYEDTDTYILISEDKNYIDLNCVRVHISDVIKIEKCFDSHSPAICLSYLEHSINYGSREEIHCQPFVSEEARDSEYELLEKAINDFKRFGRK